MRKRTIMTLVLALAASTAFAQPIDCQNELLAINAGSPQGDGDASERPSGGGDYFAVDIATGNGTLIGNPSAPFTELEYDIDSGDLVATTPWFLSQIHLLDPADGSTQDSVSHDEGALTGLEYIGGTLYGGWIPGPAAPPSDFVIVNPVTGVLTPVGPTGTGPITGLAYDEINGVLYGATGNFQGIPADLVTIDIGSGAATLVGSLGIDRVGALEFGPDGQLYAGLHETATEFPRYLVRIDTETAEVTPIGDTGFSITGLTACAVQSPVPSVPPVGLLALALVLLSLGGLALRRRSLARISV